MEMIRYEVKDQIAILTLDRSKALNALNRTIMEELSTALDNIDLSVIRCLIITGAGEKSFVAGADISEMLPLQKEEAELYSLWGNQIFRKIETLPIPVIAAVNGYALGGGCELAMSCDIRICSENAVFGQPETGLGITPGWGGTQRLARIIGTGMAKQIIFTAKNINAEEAYRIGLVNAVYPSSELMGQAETMAKQIAQNAPVAVRMCKASINEGIDLPITEAIKVEAKHFGNCFSTQDQKDAMTAFLEKRKPDAFKNQ